jgi:hypothetical protein
VLRQPVAKIFTDSDIEALTEWRPEDVGEIKFTGNS